MKLTNIITSKTFSNKYLAVICNKKFEILSNFDQDTFNKLLTALLEKRGIVGKHTILDCIEFEYTNENDGVTLDTIMAYL